MNVALTRAKHFLFIIARCRTILINPYWRDLVSHARKQQAILKVQIERENDMTPKNSNNEKLNIDNEFPVLRNLLPLHPGNLTHEFELDKENFDSDSDVSA